MAISYLKGLALRAAKCAMAHCGALRAAKWTPWLVGRLRPPSEHHTRYLDLVVKTPCYGLSPYTSFRQPTLAPRRGHLQPHRTAVSQQAAWRPCPEVSRSRDSACVNTPHPISPHLTSAFTLAPNSFACHHTTSRHTPHVRHTPLTRHYCYLPSRRRRIDSCQPISRYNGRGALRGRTKVVLRSRAGCSGPLWTL